MLHQNGISNEDVTPLPLEGESSEVDARSVPEGPSLNVSVADAPTAKYALHYNMKHKNRGMAIIFNHENFKNPNLKRTGTNADRDMLKDVLVKLGFNVKVYNDLKLLELKNTVQQVAEDNHADCDCVLFAVLTRGEFGRLYASDGYYKPEDLWSSFTADKCSSLAGKPKLFIIQACQGEESKTEIVLGKNTQIDGPMPEIYKIPNHADFLIGYSYIPGYFTWNENDNTRGSLFIQALTEELDAHKKKKKHLLLLLTRVNQKVAFNFESKMKHLKRQTSCFSSMLTRLLIFEDK